MAQVIRQHLGLDPDPQNFNLQLEGVIASGVIRGFRCSTGTDPNSVSIEAGEVWSRDADQITESTTLVNYFSAASGRALTPNVTANDRIDMVVAEYFYTASTTKPAVYKIVEGTPAASPKPPEESNVQVPIAYALMPAGATQYTIYYRAPRIVRYNCYLDNGTEKVRYGDQLAVRAFVVHDALTFLDLVEGVHINLIDAGTLSDGDSTGSSWVSSWTLIEGGEMHLAAIIAEVVAARGDMSSLDARLDVSLNENGTLKNGAISHKGLDWSVESRADCSDHDPRYYTHSEVDADIKVVNDLIVGTSIPNAIDALESDIKDKFEAIHDVGVLSGCAYVSTVAGVLTFGNGSVLSEGKVGTFAGGSTSDVRLSNGTKYIVISCGDSLAVRVGVGSMFSGDVLLRKLVVSGFAIDTNVERRNVISRPDRYNSRFCDDSECPAAGDYGGKGPIWWVGRLKIGQVTATFDAKVQVNNANGANPFEAGDKVLIMDSAGDAYLRTVQTASPVSVDIVLTIGGIAPGRTGVISEYRTIDQSMDWRDRFLSITASCAERDSDGSSSFPNIGTSWTNDTRACHAAIVNTAGSYTIRSVTNGNLYTREGVALSEANWSILNFTAAAANNLLPIFNPTETLIGHGWRLFADLNGKLKLARSQDTTWTETDCNYAYFMICINASPQWGEYS